MSRILTIINEKKCFLLQLNTSFFPDIYFPSFLSSMLVALDSQAEVVANSRVTKHVYYLQGCHVSCVSQRPVRGAS